MPARRPGRQAHSVAGAARISGRAAATFRVSAPAVPTRPWCGVPLTPCRVRPAPSAIRFPPACSAAGRTPAGPRFRPGTGQVRGDLPVNGQVDFSLRRAAQPAGTTHEVLLYCFDGVDDLLRQAAADTCSVPAQRFGG